ncbi:MAG: biopolymer transporter ExbD [Burkholderiaceae bacterium]
MSMNPADPMNPAGDDADVMVDINTTPLIDVMLVLLIMLIITIPIQTHAVKLNMPVASDAPPPTPPAVIEVTVDFDGTIGWNGEAVKDRADLQTRLYRVTRMPDQPEVHLEPNKLAPYKYVAEVMAEAQRLGVTKIGIVGNEQFTR